MLIESILKSEGRSAYVPTLTVAHVLIYEYEWIYVVECWAHLLVKSSNLSAPWYIEPKNLFWKQLQDELNVASGL